jgi:hypothetical protein
VAAEGVSAVVAGLPETVAPVVDAALVDAALADAGAADVGLLAAMPQTSQ